MKPDLSRRDFLTAGLVLPAAGFRAASNPLLPPEGKEAGPEAVRLTYRTLGKTGLKVTSLGFGCMTTSDPTVIRRAADLGINLFDTARVYQNGNNERMVGAALKDVRQKVIISSKSVAKTRAGLLADLDTSLRELGTDYLDIWYLHNRNEPGEVTEDLLEAQRAAKQSGKIRFAGVSTHFNMDKILAHQAKLGQTDVVLTTYNFAMRSVDAGQNTNPDAPRTDMTGAIRSAREAGLGIVAMKVMAGGVSRVLRGDRVYGANPQELSTRLGQPGVPVAAIRWALKNESVDTAEVCMTRPRRARREPPGDGGAVHGEGREAADGPARQDRPELLPDVRLVRGRLRERRSGSRRASVPDLCGRLWPVRARARAVPGDAQGGQGYPMQRLHLLFVQLRPWRGVPRRADPRTADAGLVQRTLDALRHCASGCG